MAETDVSHEFGREPGFSSLVFGPELSNMLHVDTSFTSNSSLEVSSALILLVLADAKLLVSSILNCQQPVSVFLS